MKVPTLTGLIKRRMLVNFRIDPDAAASVLPHPFRPKLHCSHAVGGICLIRLEEERVAGLPKLLGMSSENAAHRFAVEWTESDGMVREGVYVPRRDTDSRITQLAGGRIFASEYHAAHFDVRDDDGRIDFKMRSDDGDVSVNVVARESDELPDNSIFTDLQSASEFFESGSVGYAPAGKALDGVQLVTENWHVRPLTVESVSTSFFDDRTRFPEGTIHFDHALIMRDIRHEWRPVAGQPVQ